MVTSLQEQRSGFDMDLTQDKEAPPIGEAVPMASETPSSPLSIPRPRSPDSFRSGPLPNPPFVFPARPTASSAPSTFSTLSGRRPRSAYETQNNGFDFGRELPHGSIRSGAPPPLPDFSFNPMHPAQTEIELRSPPLSPQSPTSSLSAPIRAGHRRGGSEFIGGDGLAGGGSFLSTSPTKGEIFFPPNSQTSNGPSAGRRGHAHRRSAAISCHDLSMLTKPITPAQPPLSGSAPTSPSEELHNLSFVPSLDGAVRSDVNNASLRTSQGLASPPDSPPPRPANRNRVGFSDTLEFIPRPLSMVSSDTSSTTTLRPGHSVSGSISSVVSFGAASPPQRDRGISPPPPSTSNKMIDPRPSTAGAVLDNVSMSASDDDSTQRRNSMPLAADDSTVSQDGPLTPRTLSRRYFFFGHESTSGNASPTRSRTASSESSERPHTTLVNDSSLEQSTVQLAINDQQLQACRRPSVSKKPAKKQKKVKSWAGSILSRKNRPRSQKQKALSRRSPTPPLRAYNQALDKLSSDPEDHTKSESSQRAMPASLPNMQTNFASWKPRHLAQEDETMSPVIDLDAALGPFNTPLGRDPDWELAQRGSGPAKRAMHSAAGMKGFQGPGMHYHRRAESAPEMVAFENPRFRLHHIGSSSTMEDVFEEEEEEDDWEEVKTVSHKGSTIRSTEGESPGLGIDIKIVNTENSDANTEFIKDDSTAPQRGLKRKDSGLSDMGLVGSSAKSERSGTSLKDVMLSEELPDVVEIADSTRRPVSSTRSSDSSPTPPLRPIPKTLGSVDMPSVILQPPFLTPTTPQSVFTSPFPSPRSPMSYDANRISTTPSSFTDEHAFQSMLMGEPGPELRMSVDDVPSLTSSNSTMTRESMSNPAFGNPQFRNGQRSASVSGASITRKRSSIASLTRLLNSSHGEKSKLSIEERVPASPERKEKSGKGKRLSRMMQFWRPKEVSEHA